MKRLIMLLVGIGLTAFVVIQCSQLINNLAAQFHAMARIGG